MNLSNVWVEPDADDAQVWASQHEFAMRQRRYELYENGGLVGAIKRAVVHADSLHRALYGAGVETSDTEPETTAHA